jgi:hypothetical protein
VSAGAAPGQTDGGNHSGNPQKSATFGGKIEKKEDFRSRYLAAKNCVPPPPRKRFLFRRKVVKIRRFFPLLLLLPLPFFQERIDNFMGRTAMA